MAPTPLTTWPAIRRAVRERCSVRDAGGEWNPMGVPAGLAAWVELADELGVGGGRADFDEKEIGAALEGVARDGQLAEATGRWTLSRAPRRQPSSYLPGDVLARRSMYATDLMLDPEIGPRPGDDLTRIKVRYDGLPLARVLAEAETYWLPAGAEEGAHLRATSGRPVGRDPPAPPVHRCVAGAPGRDDLDAGAVWSAC